MEATTIQTHLLLRTYISTGGSYVTSGLNVTLDTGIDGDSYVTSGLDVEQRND